MVFTCANNDDQFISTDYLARESPASAANSATRQTRTRTRNSRGGGGGRQRQLQTTTTTTGEHFSEMTGGGGGGSGQSSDLSGVEESPAMSPEHQGQQQPQPQQLMMTMSSHLGQPTSQHLTLTAALNAEMISGGFSGMITTSTQPAIAIGGGGGGGGGGHMILESNSNSSTTSSSGTVTPTGVFSTPSLGGGLPSLTQPVVAASSQQQQQLQLGTAVAVKRQRNRHAKSPVTAKPSLRSNSNSGKRPLRPLRPLSQTVANCYCFVCTETLASPMPPVNKRRRVTKEIK